MKFKQMSWFLIFALCCTLIGPLIIPAPAQAAGISDLVTEMNKVYPCIDNSYQDGSNKTDKDYMSAARQEAQDLAAKSYDSTEWQDILDPLITAEVIAAAGDEANARQNLVSAFSDLSYIYFTDDGYELENRLTNFKNTHRDFFWDLMGNDVALDKFCSFLTASRNELKTAINHSLTTEESNLLNGKSLKAAALYGTNQELTDAMPILTKYAMQNVIDAPGSQYADLDQRLGNIGWSIDLLIQQNKVLSSYVDPDHKAELALALASVRSQSFVYDVAGASPTTPIADNAISCNVNDTFSIQLKIMDSDLTGQVDYTIIGANPNAITITDDSGATIDFKAAGAGTATLLLYRQNSQVPEHDWIAKLDVTVAAPQYTVNVSADPVAGGTVSGGGTFAANSSVTVNAAAKAGYNFAFWTENGTQVSTAASYTFTLSADLTLVAVFKSQALNNNANLSGIATSAGTLVPAFDPAVTDYRVVLLAAHGDSVPTITATTAYTAATKLITPAAALNGTTTITVTAQNGTQKTYNITFVKNTLVTVQPATTIDASEQNQNFEVPDVDLSNVQMSINIPAAAAEPTITFTPTTVGNEKRVTLPSLNVQAARNIGTVNVSVPAGTIVSGPSDWNGTIVLPTIKEQPSTAISGTGVVVLEMGAGKDADGKDIVLTFNNAVRLLLPGQKGKSAAYTRDGSLIMITQALSADIQETANTEIPDQKEAAIDVSNDKVIWTKHFTEFVAYNRSSGGGSGGGGGGGSTSAGTTVGKDGGTVSSAGATILIPANALTNDIKVTVEKVSKTGLPLPLNSEIVSEVLDIVKDKSGNFSKAVTISLSFDKSKVDTNKYDLALYWLDSAGNKWVKLDNIQVDLTNANVSGEIDHFTKFAVIATPKEIIETPVTEVELTDIAGHWGEANIKKLVEAGAISGYPDKTFKPDAHISRAEFAVTLVKTLKLAPQEGKIYDDTAQHWAKDSIATAQAYGIINGYSDTKFGPDDKITREQMAVMVAKAAGLQAADNSKTFTDSARVSAWAKDAVAAASSNEIINGYPDGSFKPQGNTSRAEAATVLVKLLK